jgi:hypothetical protein
MSKRVDRKVQSKIKNLESEPAAFRPGDGKFDEGVAPNDDNT